MAQSEIRAVSGTFRMSGLVLSLAAGLAPLVGAVVLSGCGGGGSTGGASAIPTAPTPPPVAAQPTLSLQLAVVPVTASGTQDFTMGPSLDILKFKVAGNVAITGATASVAIVCQFDGPPGATTLSDAAPFGPPIIVRPSSPVPLISDVVIGVRDKKLFSASRLNCMATASPPPAGTSGGPVLDRIVEETAIVLLLLEDAAPSTPCTLNAFRHCAYDRFQLESSWLAPEIIDVFNEGEPAMIQPGARFVDGAGFYFRDPSRRDVFVRVLDECSTTGSYSVFISGESTEQIDVLVTDTVDGVQNRFTNPRGTAIFSIFPYKIGCRLSF